MTELIWVICIAAALTLAVINSIFFYIRPLHRLVYGPERGEKGPRGEKGMMGDRGPKGDNGLNGLNGAVGPAGPTNAVSFPIVSPDLRIVSWRKDSFAFGSSPTNPDVTSSFTAIKKDGYVTMTFAPFSGTVINSALIYSHTNSALPSGWKPAVNLEVPVSVGTGTSGSDVTAGFLSINSDGGMSIGQAVVSGGKIVPGPFSAGGGNKAGLLGTTVTFRADA